jgi:hypothetical protein
MGSLGRDRCFIVCEDRPDLKLPSDLLGVKSAAFLPGAGARTRKSLAAQCAAIAERIAALDRRHKVDPAAVALQTAIRAFGARVEGAWWSRITRRDPVNMSFVHIEPDPLFNSVCLKEGKSFDRDGNFIANWKSVLAGVDPDQLSIRYSWSGWHTTPERANSLFLGLGEMVFDKPAGAKAAFVRGSGRFWDVDESHPEKTRVKPTQHRRLTDEKSIAIMTSGNEKEVRALVRKTLLDW